MDIYIKDLIKQGEHQQLDFKFEISDSRKIARSMVAFANTDGGRLLVGVKDNGKIAGIRSDEEYYMLDNAANMYCKPPVPFKVHVWPIDGKTILEVVIEKSETDLHMAPDPNNRWMVYVRAKDQNRLANTVMLKLWERNKKPKGTFIKYSEKERIVLEYLQENETISMGKLKNITSLSRYKAEILLVNLLAINLLKIEFQDNIILYRLNKEATTENK